ncbi:MAG: DNA polymerase III subunit chi [Gammaproteobacteria bacterium]|nr:DNA polymerase III subunit chi [Gammaproteobacteria bacterium]
MTSVYFHIVPAQAKRQHDVFVCQLIEREWQTGRTVHVHCCDDTMVASFDDLLWTFRDTSFVPHAIVGASDASGVRVMLGCANHSPATHDTLVNLHPEIPAFFSQFERVIETTGHDDNTRQLARERYRFYKDRGYALATHQP